MDEFLDLEDKEILAKTLNEFGCNPEGFWRFWSWRELQNVTQLTRLAAWLRR